MPVAEAPSPISAEARSPLSSRAWPTTPDKGDIVLFGGTPDYANYYNQSWVLSGSGAQPLSGAETSSDQGCTDDCVGAPPGRYEGSMASLPGGGVLLTGGYDGQGSDSDTWTWDGSSWSDLSPTPAAPSSSGDPIALDTGTGQVVLYDPSGTWTYVEATVYPPSFDISVSGGGSVNPASQYPLLVDTSVDPFSLGAANSAPQVTIGPLPADQTFDGAPADDDGHTNWSCSLSSDAGTATCA